MTSKDEGHRRRSRFRGFWRDGAGPVLAAMVLALGVATALDVIGARDPKPKKAAQANAAKKGAPRYVVAVRQSGDAVVVRDLLSGSDVGVAAGAPAGRRFHQVAAAGDGSYIVSDYAAGTVAFHRLTLGKDGRPYELTAVPVARLRGISTEHSGLAVSRDRIAYVTYRGHKGRVDVVSTKTGARRAWTTAIPGQIGSLSWSGDTISFVWSKAGAAVKQVRTLDTTSTGGDLGASKLALILPKGGVAALLSGDGRTIVAGVRDQSAVSLEVFSAATRERTKVLWTGRIQGTGRLAEIARDSSGRHLLARATDGMLFADPARGVRELPATGIADVAW